MTKRTYRILALIIALFATTASASAQGKAVKTSAKSLPAAQAEKAADDPEQFRKEFIRAAEEYRNSLKELAAYGERDAQKLEEQHGKLKELYADGLIARREIEASDKALSDARAKVEDIRKQLAQADTTLEAARKPPATVGADIPTTTLARVEPAWTTGSKQVDGLIRMYGTRYGVDPYLVFCVMHQESRFGSGAVSPKGAQGLMQLMPGTAARYGVTNPYDPAQNIMAGTRYLRDLLRMFGGRVDLALAGYNAGEGAVMKYGNRVPPYNETRNYVRIIGARYNGGSGLTPTAKTSQGSTKAAQK
jgi:soluble lytic murein transglycosylase-like protein